MAFQPIVPLDGYVGWKFLQRTLDRQIEVFDKSPEIQRDIDYFKENIANATEVQDLITDRRLLKVALGAFGLQDEVNKQALVRKVLEGGVLEPTSFANRLNNTQYKEMTKAFGYGDLGFFPTQEFIDDIAQKYKDKEFEVALGNVNADMRIALNFERSIGDLATSGGTTKGLWFKVMGDVPLRTVFETAYNLPTEFSQLDVDRQQEILEERTKKEFGEGGIDIFSDPEKVEKLIRIYQVRSQIANGPSALTPGATGFAVLQASGFGGGAAQNLFLSNL